MSAPRKLTRHLLHGALAGAAGTTALNAVTYLDMALRRRPASATPQQAVERGADLMGLGLPTDGAAKQGVEGGLGALLGIASGVGAGAVLGAVRGRSGRPTSTPGATGVAFALAMVAGNGPMTALAVTDPRQWRPVDWVADVLPHLAFAVVTAVTLDSLD